MEQDALLFSFGLVPIMPWTQYLSLSSRDANLVLIQSSRQRYRFVLDCALVSVDMVELITMELQQRTMTVSEDSGNVLFFSEDVDPDHGPLITYRAVLPCGTYRQDTLWSSLEASMACAQPVFPVSPALYAPLNQYTFRPLQTDSHPHMVLTSNGRVRYQVHTCSDKLTVQSLELREDEGVLDIRFLSPHPYPLARGAVVDLVHPLAPSVRSHVVRCSGPFAVHVALPGASAPAAAPAAAPAKHFPDDDRWTLIPLSAGASIHPLLGFPDSDVGGGTRVPIQSISSPLAGPGPVLAKDAHHRTLVVATMEPHGCHVGDTVLFAGLFKHFLETRMARVVCVLSEYHVSLEYDTAFLVDGPGHLEVVVSGEAETGADTQVLRIQEHTLKKIGDNVLWVACVCQDGDRATGNVGDWVSILPRSSFHVCPELLVAPCRLVEMSVDGASFTLEFGYSQLHQPPQTSSSVGAHLVRVAGDGVPTTYVGTKKMDCLRNRRVVHMRLWMGASECTGVVVCKNQRSHDVGTFARAQLKPCGPDQQTLFLTRADDSAIGWSVLAHAPIQKVAYLDMEFLSEEGEVLDKSQIGDWSLLLRVGGS